jgi:hypothetical protein
VSFLSQNVKATQFNFHELAKTALPSCKVKNGNLVGERRKFNIFCCFFGF